MTTPYLYEHENLHAAVRSNGLRFHGYPTRSIDRPDLIVIHTAENLVDLTPPDTGAEAVAAFLSSLVRVASAHFVCDSDSSIVLLPDEATAFHVRGYNTRGLGIEIATQAHKWADLPPEFADALMQRAAAQCAVWSELYDIPVKFLTRAQVDAGEPGFTGHTNLDPTRRSDPGFDAAQWAHFLELVNDAKGNDMTNTLTVGHTGHAVAGVQAALNKWLTAFPDPDLVPLTVDGVFGPATAERVAKYQAAAQLPDVTGNVDGPTLSWLHEYRIDRADPPPSPAQPTVTVDTAELTVVTGVTINYE